MKENYNIENLKVIINPNLKLSIKTPLEFWLEAPLTKLLGFGNKLLIIKSNEEKPTEDYPKLRPFDNIEIHCNLVEPSITKHISYIKKYVESEILYSLFSNVQYKSKISEKPNEIHYVPIIKYIKQIEYIIISNHIEKGNLLKMRVLILLYL